MYYLALRSCHIFFFILLSFKAKNVKVLYLIVICIFNLLLIRYNNNNNYYYYNNSNNNN